MIRKLLLISFIFATIFTQAQDYLLPRRPAVIAQLAPFYHGVASGDPLSDRVIIWTRVTIPFNERIAYVNIDSASGVYSSSLFDTTVQVNWQIATDTGFTNVINSGIATTDSSMDYTIKVDVTGLQPNSWYYYRFNTGGTNSITGRTRTLPVGNADSLRLALFSCSDFQSGYFNVYHDIASRNDIDLIMHVGDWFYEYQAGGSDYQNDTSRLHPLDHDAFTVADYRLWHSQYRLDQDLRDMLQEYPLLYEWDDHDVANNSWHTGAQNHNAATQGPWSVRLAAAQKVHFEWMPLRPVAIGNDSIIHRNFKWGNLANIMMLDTRLEGRDSTLGSAIPTNNAYLTDTNRQMLGRPQLAWVKTQLSDTTTQWRLLGSQVMISPLLAFGLILNGDQWDGYPAERKRVFDHIMQNNIKDVVFLTGDIHSSWANDLPHPDSTYVSGTGAGSVATEFVGTSVTSTATGLSGLGSVIQLGNPQSKYIEFTKRGYLLFDVNKQRAQGDFIHMSTVASRTYTTSDDAQWVNLDGERHLRTGSGLLGPRLTPNPSLVPFVTVPATGVNEVNGDKLIMLTCFPNPTAKEIALQYYLNSTSSVDVFVTDMTGQVVYDRGAQNAQPGLFSTKVSLDNLAAGQYIVSVSAGGKVYSKSFVVNR